MDTSCIVLAGGKGVRLGYNKVLETVGNKSLLYQVISSVNSLCSEIIIVTTREQAIPQSIGSLEFRIVTDIFPGKGTLGGIYTGLVASNSFYNLVVACDMPFLNQSLLRYMLELSAGSDIVVPRVREQFEPLHAIYAKSCLAPMEDMIKQDNLIIYNLFSSVKVRYVEAEEIARFDPEHLSFFNINTEADLKKARELTRRMTNL